MTASPTTEEMVEGGLRSSLLGIVINLALALVKCAAGLIGHSFALLADGIESFLDVISSSVVYYGLRLAIKPPDKDHPYGHGKADPIAAAVVGVAMILAAIGIAATRRGGALDGRPHGGRLGCLVRSSSDPTGGLAAAPPPSSGAAGHRARAGD